MDGALWRRRPRGDRTLAGLPALRASRLIHWARHSGDKGRTRRARLVATYRGHAAALLGASPGRRRGRDHSTSAVSAFPAAAWLHPRVGRGRVALDECRPTGHVLLATPT